MALFRSAATVSSFTLLSRITGLVRDILIARAFGAGALTDAFWIAFRIPNLLRRLFAEGAFAQAFVPILGAARTQHGDDGVRVLLDRVALILTLALMSVTLLGIVAAPWVVSAMASGLRGADRGAEFGAAVWMTRVMFPYILCMSLVAFASGVLNTWRKFAVPAFTPVLLNLSMIGAAIWLAPRLEVPIYALAAGVMAGGILQLLIQWMALARLGMLPRFTLRVRDAWSDPTVRHILRQMAPATLGVSVAQISLLINTNIATWLTPGSVTWLSFADRLMEFPTALLGVALGTVLLPSLSAAHAREDRAAYSALLDWGLRMTLLLGLPAALGMMLLSDGLVATLFHYGAFQASDVQQTRLAVIAYSVGLIGLLSVKILAPGFYAKQDIRTPVKIAVLVLVLTQVMNAIFVPLLAHAGLALAIGLGACINALLLLIGLRRRDVYQPDKQWLGFLLRIVPALLALAAVLLWADHHLNWIALRDTPWLRAGWLAAVLAACGAAYFGVLFIMGMRPRDFTRRSLN
ncbi:murein biosynthesis integral membrane protein MurJ [Bordetella avium]|uniref:Probable lipid II flippase MurJ n=1 Tax=Bordetella avium (strain 197N) TaxID=360910 RepID=Q2KZE1_BORA1|nr:murein biosynthesis integral membrane protein MurJ [Bordetella avium]AZY49420.1 murein biosynthesis integral membrane protein MurJ [Bordetella avium]AZY52773.1 murein biosynthesis integral membrane protein MurJ [Bordetella avium]RIQ12116.1 murein biosynthesis integral membrane protein MurJ [Bordetella avium]RIQ19065.1 murein biosynthesis integral membrane protein MurJ [Bordetella avium]RIQ31975.1 murein biosynthesis integral membrane protein MurJ [Bordetella avium]